MKRKLLTCLLALCMILVMLPAAALADGDGSSGPAAKIGTTTYGTVEEAISKAQPDDTVVILAGTHTSKGQVVNVNADITIEGEGDRASQLVDYVFNVGSGTGTNARKVTFQNLSFTGKSQIRVGFANGLTDLTVDDCYARLTWDSRGSSGNAQQGELIYLGSGYSSSLDLTVENSDLINAHTIADEDASPIIFGEGTLVKTANITNNTFGSEKDPCDRVAIKFGRRTDDTQINISDNTVYGATTADKDFYILNFYQSGENPYKGLDVILANNEIYCTPNEGRSVAAAYIQDSVLISKDEENDPSIVAADGNTLNGKPCDTVVKDQKDPSPVPVAEAKLVTADGTTYYATAQKAINAAPDGSTVTLLQDAGDLDINGKTNIIVDGNGRNVGSVTFSGTNDGVTLKRATFNNMATANAIKVGVTGAKNKNITISGCTFNLGENSPTWAAIYVQVISNGLIIEDNTFNINKSSVNEFHCIGFAYTSDMEATDTVIRNNKMNSNQSDGNSYFVIGTKSDKDGGRQEYGITNLEISGNTITYGENTPTNQWATSLSNIDGLEVDGNTFNNCSVCLFLSSSNDLATRNVTVTNNVSDAEKVIYIYGTNALTGSFKTDEPADKVVIAGNSGATNPLITVSFNANGGSCDEQVRVLALTDGSVKLGELPVPTRSGSYEFAGWFDENGKLVTADTVLTKNTELYARWDYTGPVGSTVTVAETANGSVKVEPNFADVGDTVTITATPDVGYRVKDVVVTDIYGDELDVSRASDGTYSFVMPRSRVTVTVTFEQLSTSFTDVAADDYYYDAVIWAVKNGVTTGITDTTFGPELACTRAQMVTFLWRAAGSPIVDAANPFYDVQPGDYYYDAVKWAVSKGITTGVTASTFCPDDTVSRAQTVTFLWRFDGSKAAEGSSFTDVSADAYYAAAVDWAVANGVTDGLTATGFGPDAVCTRAQIVTFLYRCMG